jgi:hypothetical protein
MQKLEEAERSCNWVRVPFLLFTQLLLATIQPAKKKIFFFFCLQFTSPKLKNDAFLRRWSYRFLYNLVSSICSDIYEKRSEIFFSMTEYRPGVP